MKFFKRTNAVAIDGPAGSGKSTVSKLVAERLDFTYIDTGAMYRALTLKAMKENVDFTEESNIIELSANLDLKLLPACGQCSTIRAILDGKDVTEVIRSMEVTRNVKHVAKIGSVRKNMLRLQRKMAEEAKGAVMEGRDIGTMVLPKAKYKFYLDASFDERLKRRLSELRAKGQAITQTEVADDLRQRDHTDKTRKVGPLKKAKDAIFIDTTNLSIEEVVDKIIKYIQCYSTFPALYSQSL